MVLCTMVDFQLFFFSARFCVAFRVTTHKLLDFSIGVSIASPAITGEFVLFFNNIIIHRTVYLVQQYVNKKKHYQVRDTEYKIYFEVPGKYYFLSSRNQIGQIVLHGLLVYTTSSCRNVFFFVGAVCPPGDFTVAAAGAAVTAVG